MTTPGTAAIRSAAEQARARFSAMLTLDPHKGLFLPYGTGALLVRDGSALRAVHATTADYLPDTIHDDAYDPSHYGPELSRGFPGLRVWLTVKTFGAARVRAAIAPPQLSLFAFHLTLAGRDGRGRERGDARAARSRRPARPRLPHGVHDRGALPRARLRAQLPDAEARRRTGMTSRNWA